MKTPSTVSVSVFAFPGEEGSYLLLDKVVVGAIVRNSDVVCPFAVDCLTAPEESETYVAGLCRAR